MNKIPELLAPAGGMEQLESAILYGADAVYLGGDTLSLRSKCKGFSQEGLARALDLAHMSGVKVYWCLNAMPYENSLDDVRKNLESLIRPGIDALIASDPGVVRMARRLCPDLELHLSTQAHSVNSESARFWQEAGVDRINLARELSLEDIKAIIKQVPSMKFEVFVHGAMCLSLSGHCLISAWANNRPANHGQCTQPCRFEYRGMRLVVEEKLRQGTPFLDIIQGEDFSSIWAPQDLCLARWLDLVAAAGPAALKIEGRTKSGGYIAQVTDAYRTALNALEKNGGAFRDISDRIVGELVRTSVRPLCSGFLFPERIVEQAPDRPPCRIIARIEGRLGDGSHEVSVKSTWNASLPCELVLPGMRRPVLSPGEYELVDHEGRHAEILHPGMRGRIVCGLDDIPHGMYMRA